MAVTDQFLALFVPETQAEGFQTREQRDGLHCLKKRIGLVAFFQVVIGNAGAEMVNMMKPNVAGEPLQNLRQLVEGTALQGRRREVPILSAFPINALELMLNIKHPYARATSRHERNELNEQISLEAKNQTQDDGHSEDGQIHRINGMPFPPTGLGRRKPLPDHKQEQRRNDKQYDGIAHESVSEFFPARCFQIFLHGQRPDVAGPAPVQIARAAMMDGVFPAPMVVGGEG
jgi:hypothetical protein